MKEPGNADEKKFEKKLRDEHFHVEKMIAVMDSSAFKINGRGIDIL